MADADFLNWPFFDERHRALQSDLSKWADATIDADREFSAGEVDDACRSLVAALGKGGWLRHTVPAAHGGVSESLDVRSLAIIRDTLAQRSGLADFSFAMQGLGGGPITLAGSRELQAQYLPAVSEGKKIAAFALSEPRSGSDVANMDMKADRDGNGFVLNGEKTFVSNGGIADFYCVFARTGEAPGAKGISAFVVDADTPGLKIAERIDTIAPHPLARVRFTDCKISAERLLGEPGKGFGLAMATLDIFRATVGAAALGFARRALDEAVKRATTRELFGGPMSDLQMVQAMLADMALAVDSAALLVYRAAWTKDVVGGRVSRESAMAKLAATESAQEVIDKAVQIHGGYGVVCGTAVERLYREIRSLRIYEGASEVQKVVIARQLMQRKGSALA